jgi:hypothetical protein
VDIFPRPMSPTWRNGHLSPYGVSKRLDIFLLNSRFMGDDFRSRSWVINSLILDHNPVCLQLEASGEVTHFPFKFNHAWLKEADFLYLVRSSWKNFRGSNETSASKYLVSKLKFLKKVVIQWQKEKVLKIRTELDSVVNQIQNIFLSFPSQIFLEDIKNLLIKLEKRKEEILLIEEQSWWLKRRDNLDQRRGQ